MCCPGVLIYVVNLISFIDLDLIKIVMWCEIDYMYDWTYSIVLRLKYIIGSTDLLISCHVRNNNYELCKVWIFENKLQI